MFHARPYSGFIEIKSRNFIEQIKVPSFLEPQSNLEYKDNPSILKNDFLSRLDSFIFTSIAQLFDRSYKKNGVFPALKSTSHFLTQSPVSQLYLLPKIRGLITLGVEGMIIWKVINVCLEKRRTNYGNLGTPKWTGYSCKSFPSRTIWSHLLLKNDKIQPNAWQDDSFRNILKNLANTCGSSWSQFIWTTFKIQSGSEP